MHWMTKSKMQYGNLKIYSNPISQGMRQDVDTFVETLKKMDNLPDDEEEEEEEEEEESIGSKIDFGGTKSKMVGLSDQFERVKQSLKKTHISLIGMAGIGKTALVAQAILSELDPTNYYKFTEGDERIEVVRFLNEEESANLLCEKVFGKRDFPSQLEKAAKKIAKKCEGLPLMIVTVASYLSNAEKTPEYWTEVAEKKISVFVDAYTDISKHIFETDPNEKLKKTFACYLSTTTGSVSYWNALSLHCCTSRAC